MLLEITTIWMSLYVYMHVEIKQIHMKDCEVAKRVTV